MPASTSSSSSSSRSSSSTAATYSRQVQEALQATLAAYLPAMLPAGAGASYRYRPEEFSAIRCPAIFIYDGGWEKIFETIRGLNPDGSTKPGIAQRRYSFDVDVYLRGVRVDDLREELQAWADAIAAVVEDHWTLDNGAIDAQASRGDPTAPLAEGSSVLMATRIEVRADVWEMQGQLYVSSSQSSVSSSSQSSSSSSTSS